MTSTAISLPFNNADYDFSGSLLEDDEFSEYPSPQSSPKRTKPLIPQENFINTIAFSNYTEFILEFILPILWCIAFSVTMDRQSLLDTIYMPFLGLMAAFLANSVPIGGGIVYVPVLHFLGTNMHLGVSFSVATMSIGNGLLGFLRWLQKNPSLIIWESFPYSIISSSLGSLIAFYLVPRPNLTSIKHLFTGFCIILGMIVGLSSRKGGFSNTFSSLLNDSSTPSSTLFLRSSINQISDPQKWIILSIVNFLAGLILVPNIAVGPALTTYLVLDIYGYDSESAIVTGIITGGWVCIVPFLVHLFEFGDVPIKLWLMVLPGVYFGAKYAPLTHEYVGMPIILALFAFFLFMTAFLYALN